MIYNIGFGRNIWPSVEVEGEFARETAIVKVIGGRPSPGRDVELENVAVTLVPEPGNLHDKNAVAVQAAGHVLGYLSRADAVRFQQPIYRITASGAMTATTARIWASTDDWSGQKKFRARVTVALPEPGMMLPLNDPPEGDYSLLPWGGGLQVIKEEDHFDVLSHHVPPSGEGLLYVSLHRGIRTLKNGTEKPYIEVRADGEPVGEMSSVTSAHFLPTVEHLESTQEIPTALARLTGSALAAQLVLQAAKAPEIPDEWLANSPNQMPKLLPWAASYKLAAAPARQKAPVAATQSSVARPQTARALPPDVTAAPKTAEPSPLLSTPQKLVRGGNSKPGPSIRFGVSVFVAVIGLLFALAFIVAGLSMVGSNFGGAIVGVAFGAAIGWAALPTIRYGRTGSFRKKP